MTPSALKAQLADLGDAPSEFFKRASLISRFILENGPTSGWLNQYVIRLHADVLDSGSLELLPITNGLVREVGLFPYLEGADINWADQFALNAHRVTNDSETPSVFHRAQLAAYDILESGKSLVLSAPTSFGKSFLIDAVIAANHPKCVVLVVPTLALLDEQRRRLERKFRNSHKVIYRNDQNYDPMSGRIFVLTQERLLDRGDIDHVDLFIVDEFYKLNADSKDVRSKCLNIVFRHYSEIASQIFLLGPNLDVSGDWERIGAARMDTDAATVATALHDYTASSDKEQTLREVISSRSDEKTIVFCKSPASCRRLANMSHQAEVAHNSEVSVEFGHWIAENYHPSWIVAQALGSGVGMHHGAMPRGISQQMLRFFDDADLNLLFCTSTIIEGVNTKAENIVIYDNKIRSKNIDYFSYKNISGRAGRFGKYMIGNVFIFNAPPDADDFQLEIPGLIDPPELDDEYIIGVDGFEFDSRYAEQRERIERRLELPADIIAQLATFPLDSIEVVAERVLESVQQDDENILWSGQAEYVELKSVLELGWREFATGASVYSASQACFFAFRMRSARGNIRRYLDQIAIDVSETALQSTIDNALRAIKDVEFYVPSVLSAVEVLVNYFRRRSGKAEVDYSTMATILEGQFLPKYVKGLEEIGIPTPVGVKLSGLVSELESLDSAIDRLASSSIEELMEQGLTLFESKMAMWAVR